jgi:hypothetical protein
MPRATVTVTVTPTTDSAEEPTLCELGGVGVQHFRADGGKATIRFGDRGVCLMSAVPNEGFTAKTVQTDPAELTVIFLSDQHESEINATALPGNQASVVESPH